MTISNILSEKNLISGPAVKDIFDNYYEDILDLDITSPSKLMNELWSRYPNKIRSGFY